MYIAIMGYGTVGSGVAEVLKKNHASILKKSGQEEMDIKYILDLRDFPGDPNEDKVIKDFNVILEDPEVRIVVETMGGIHPAFEFTMACLKAGKSVVSSNKALVAEKGLELLEAAEEHQVNYLFEASVGGGIPIIRPMSQCLAANEIDAVAGILNGTTNFILTKMIEDGMSFEDALALAQERGYAERDPSADIEGDDACRKVCILASLAFGKHVYPEQVETQGITKITLEDVEYVHSMHGVIKLLGQIQKLEDGRITAFVSPAVVMKGSQLAGVDGVFNAILVRGDALGDVVFYGRGAGKLPTASAVVADVIDCAKHLNRKKIFGWKAGSKDYVADHNILPVSYYIRAAGNKAAVEEAFGNVCFLSRKNQPEDEFAFVTPVEVGSELNQKLDALPGVELRSKICITDY